MEGRTVFGLSTRLVREYGVKYPFVGAGMAFVGLPPLVAAVNDAGGIGVVGAAPAPPEGARALIQGTKALTSGLFGVDFILAHGPHGPFVLDDHIEVCVEQKVQLVIFHWTPPPAAWVQRLHAAGARVWAQVASVEQAIEAVGVGVDGIVAQGSEAGGHSRSTTPLFQLLPQIVSVVGGVMVLAAGGIADGKGVARALAHGAEGVWVGTRLVASTEAYAHPEYKNRIVQAREGSTVSTTMFGPEWPGQPVRVLRNRIVDEWAGREGHIPDPPPPPAVIGDTLLGGAPYPMPKFSASVPTPDTSGDFEEMCMPAGESAALIHDIKPVREIIAEMMSSAERIAETERRGEL